MSSLIVNKVPLSAIEGLVDTVKNDTAVQIKQHNIATEFVALLS